MTRFGAIARRWFCSHEWEERGTFKRDGHWWAGFECPRCHAVKAEPVIPVTIVSSELTIDRSQDILKTKTIRMTERIQLARRDDDDPGGLFLCQETKK